MRRGSGDFDVFTITPPWLRSASEGEKETLVGCA